MSLELLVLGLEYGLQAHGYTCMLYPSPINRP